MRIGYYFSVVLPCQYSQESASNNDRISSDDEMQMLVDSIRNKTGLACKHLLPLQHLANEINCIISFRPVDNLATGLIESGYPTKGFHIKGKVRPGDLRQDLSVRNNSLASWKMHPLNIYTSSINK